MNYSSVLPETQHEKNHSNNKMKWKRTFRSGSSAYTLCLPDQYPQLMSGLNCTSSVQNRQITSCTCTTEAAKQSLPPQAKKADGDQQLNTGCCRKNIAKVNNREVIFLYWTFSIRPVSQTAALGRDMHTLIWGWPEVSVHKHRLA